MSDLHAAAYDASETYGHPGDYVIGANAAGFVRVAEAMLAQGLI
jgi:glutamate dehydrogenase (NADP+)